MIAAAQLSARSLLRTVGVDDPQIDPRGEWILWRRSVVDEAHNCVISALVLTPSAGGDERILVTSRLGMRLARWSPDGAMVAFVAPHDGAPEIFVVPREGGDPRRVTALAGGISEFAWSPRGDNLALVLPRHVGPPQAQGHSQGVMRVTRLRWKRDGVGLIGDRFDQLALVSFAPDAEQLVNQVTWLVKGRVDVGGVAWSPDGFSLAFVMARLETPETSMRLAVYRLDLTQAGMAPVVLAEFANIRAQSLAWSSCGRELSVTGHDREGWGHYGAQRLWQVDAYSGARRAVTQDAQGTLGNAAYSDTGGAGNTAPVWLSDGSGWLAVISGANGVRLTHVDLAGSLTPLTAADRVIAGFDVAADATFAVVVAHPRTGSSDLERVELSSGSPQRAVPLTFSGTEILAGVRACEPQHFTVDDARGPLLDAWILRPEGCVAGSTPVILYTGGGPGGMRWDNFHFEWQLFVAAGWSVVWVNTRGCQGYGDPFCADILGSWGEADVLDNLRALDTALERFPELDRSRQAVAGGSYGGFQVAWLIGATDRFCAAVADRVVADKIAAFGMSDIGAQRAFEFGGALPWEDWSSYLAQSPINRIAAARTPTLVVHSAQDHRCTVGQGEALYASLRQLGVETRLVRFPNESHGLSRDGRPWHRVRRLQEYLDWFGRHFSGASVENQG